MTAHPSGLHHTPKCTMLAQAVTGKPTQFNILDSSRPANVTRKPLFGLDRTTLEALMAEMCEPAWRGRQLAEAMYVQRVTELDGITTLPLALRRRMAEAGREVCRPAIA